MNQRIKVVHLIESLDIGGIEKLIETIAVGIDKSRYNVSVWGISCGGRIADRLRKAGVEVRILGIDTYYNPGNFFKLASMFHNDRIDIIHTHTYFSNTIGRIAAKIAGVKGIVTHVHSTYWEYSWRNLFVERFLSTLTDVIICCSNAVKDFVVNHEGVNEQKVVTIYNGVNKAERGGKCTRIAQELGIRDSDIVIITIGSLYPNKGHDILLEALARDECRQAEVKCLIVGNGPMKDNLKYLVDDLGIESNVIFAGLREDIGDLLSVSDIFVLPSLKREGLGSAILEAMSAGLPVVASNIGGIPEVVIDTETGYLFNPGDVNELAAIIAALISDRDKRCELGSAGMELYNKRFRADIMISKIEQIYGRIIGNE